MRRRLLSAAVLVCALGLGACGGGTSASSTSAATEAPRAVGQTTAGATRCSSAQLSLSYLSTQGATGHVEVTFGLRNVSAHSCSLRGYPGAQMFDPGGSPLATHVKWGNGFFSDTLSRPRRILLAPGAGARFGLSFALNSEYHGGQTCPAASELESVPPNAYQALHVSLTGAGRPRFAPCGGQLVASPVYVR